MINIESKFGKYDFIEPINNNLYFDNKLISDETLKYKTPIQINDIILEYFENKELKKSTIYKLREDYIFRVDLLKDIQTRIENIIINSSTLLFKELVTVINLLSLGKKYNIFEKYNEYSSNEISKLFKDYETVLKELSLKNKDDFELTFDYYITLLNTFNELCVINSTDVKRKKSIEDIVELITQSINTIKFTINLDEEKIGRLSSFQSGLLINFSNVLYISTKNKTTVEIINKYEFIYNKQIDGFFLASMVSTEVKNSHHMKFLANSTELLLLLLIKFEQYENIAFEKLDSVLKTYNEQCNIRKENITSIKEFKNSLLNNFVYIYDKSLEIKHTNLIKHIISNDKFTSTNMQIIHNYILFSDDIKEEELEQILTYVLNLPKMQNDYHEYHKLKTIDVVINKLITINCFENLKLSVPLIVEYLENSNTASQLLSVFSKIYLSLSYYYSLLGKDYLQTSQEQYFIGEKICSFTLIKDEYKEIFEKIIFNNAQTYFDSINLPNKFNQEELKIFGNEMMNDFFKNQEMIIKYNVNNSIEKVVEQILKDKNYNESNLEENISHIISNEIFFGLAQCKIVRNNDDIFSFQEIGYEILEYKLINDYKILYKYSYSYKESFNSIFLKNETYIKNNLTNLLLSYLMKINEKKSYDIYLDDDSFTEYESLVHNF